MFTQPVLYGMVINYENRQVFKGFKNYKKTHGCQ